MKDASSPAVASDAAALLSDHPRGRGSCTRAPADALGNITRRIAPVLHQSNSAVRSFVATAGGVCTVWPSAGVRVDRRRGGGFSA